METDKKYYSYPYPRPALTADSLVYRLNHGILELLVIRRANDPFKGCWALPGGFAEEHETIEVCALRELKEESGISVNAQLPLGLYATPGRDPRGWVVSEAFITLVSSNNDMKAVAGDDAEQVKWLDCREVVPLQELAFDHGTMHNDALALLANEIWHKPLLFELLPTEFTLSDFTTAMYWFGVKTPIARDVFHLLQWEYGCLNGNQDSEEGSYSLKNEEFQKLTREQLSQSGVNFWQLVMSRALCTNVLNDADWSEC